MFKSPIYLYSSVLGGLSKFTKTSLLIKGTLFLRVRKMLEYTALPLSYSLSEEKSILTHSSCSLVKIHFSLTVKCQY